MSKRQIRQLIEDRVTEDGVIDTGVKGVQLFRGTEAVRCAPAVYEPTVVAIVSGTKEAILDGTSHVYDSESVPVLRHVHAGGGRDTHGVAGQPAPRGA